MSSVKVSVCIPTYNGAEFIAQAIESVLTQSFADFELLVVDDGSTDTTLDIVRSITDPRMRILQTEKRLGIPGNWNRCLALAQGEYVCLFHQDDVMLSENLERKVEILTSDATVTLVHSAAEFVTEESAPTVLEDWMENAAEDFITEGYRYFRKLLLHGNLICAPAVVARRQKLLDLGGFDEELGFACDYEMWMKLCVMGRVAFLNQPLVRYRWHEGNASHAYRFESGIEEIEKARRRALQYCFEELERREEGVILQDAVTALDKLRRWAVKLERAKEWLEGQRANWQKIAEERERLIQEQKAWTEELERAKEWLEGQLANWQKIAEERERLIQEQKGWIGRQFEQGKEMLERQWRSQQDSFWRRLGVRLRLLKPSSSLLPDTNRK